MSPDLLLQVPPLVLLLATTAGTVVLAICTTVVKVHRLRLGRHFGDQAAASSGRKAERAHQLARECINGRPKTQRKRR